MNQARPTLHVVSNADERFFPGLAVAVASAVAAASGSRDYHFHIIDGGLVSGSLDELRKKIGRIADKKGIKVTLEPLAISQTRLQALPERRGSRMTYAKLVLPEALPHLDSIIYLDADVLCFAGLENVHPPVEQTQWLLAGAKDYFAVIEKDCPWIDQVPVDEWKLPYINCGVMWMNLKGLREMHFTDKSITARAAIGAARQGDQSVFNFLCRGKSYILPSAINHRTEIGSTRPFCEGNLNLNIHYIGAPKPWLGSSKTSKWLAYKLWHQAAETLYPDMVYKPMGESPADLASIRRKTWLYSVLNPKRAAHYRSDIRSLSDPGKVISKASAHWAITNSP